MKEFKKNKNTALYYLSIRKIMRDGYKVTTFYGSKFFDENLIQKKKILMDCCETVSADPENMDDEDPEVTFHHEK